MRLQTGTWNVFLATTLCLISWSGAPAQTRESSMKRHWKAWWITSAEGPQREFGVFHFRKTFTMDSVPQHFVIHASGDNRYELFVNGERVVEGPARGDLNHWRYETLDIASRLKPGRNVLAAVVWNFAGMVPMAQLTNETGLIVQGNTTAEDLVNTDESWKVLKSKAVQMILPDERHINAYCVTGPGEEVDGTLYPWGWETRDYGDSGWRTAVRITRGGPRGIIDSSSRWMLIPRTIPLMEERPERLTRVVRTSGVDVSPEFLKGTSPLTVPENSRATILFDQTYLTTGYPEIITSGGRGASITLAYAEALTRGKEKGNRNETEGKELLGKEDRFRPDGGEHRSFRPLWWRTYRYLQVDVETGPEALTIDDLRPTVTVDAMLSIPEITTASISSPKAI